MLTDEDVSVLADRILRKALEGHGYDCVEVRSGADVDDAPSLFVNAILVTGVPVVRGDVINSAAAALRNELLKNGEIRFPYLSLVHPDDEFPVDASPNSGSDRTERTNG
jgi:hypothetical protein